MRRLLSSFVIVFAALLFLPSDVQAQAAIAGVVRDSSGAALPGVTRFYNNGAPAQVQVRNTPIDESIERMNADLGFYAQDAWTMNRLTLNLGARYDYFNAEVPALSAPASQWVAARDRPAVENVPNWHDWAIRLAAAYKLVRHRQDGNQGEREQVPVRLPAALGFAEAFNTLTAATETRTWNDASGNRSVLDANGNLQRNEILGGTAASARPPAPNQRDAALQARVQLGIRRDHPARTVPARVGVGRLSPPDLRQPGGHRQPEPGRGRVVAVHDCGAARPAAAWRRRISRSPCRHAECEQGRHGHRQPAHLLDQERAHLQRRGRQRECAHRPERGRSCSAASLARAISQVLSGSEQARQMLNGLRFC